MLMTGFTQAVNSSNHEITAYTCPDDGGWASLPMTLDTNPGLGIHLLLARLPSARLNAGDRISSLSRVAEMSHVAA